MFSINRWTVEGKVTELMEYKRGYWFTVRGVAKNHKVFCSDTYSIKCWILKKNLKDKPINNLIKVTGRFVFKKDKCYFVAEDVA